MDDHRKTNGRENFFFGERAVINKKLQFRLVLLNLSIFACYLVTSLVFVSIKLNKVDLKTIAPDVLRVDLFLSLSLIFLGFALVSVVANMYQSFKASAPIYRLARYFRDVAASEEVLPLSFRKDDYYQELPPLIVEAFKRVREKDFIEYEYTNPKRKVG